MASFQFKYETVLRHHQRIEDERQRDLAQHLRGRMIMHEQLRRMQETISSSKRDLASGLVGKVDLDSMAGFARYSGQVTQRAHQIVRRLASLEGQISQCRERLLEATRRRKALELLREKHHEAWRKQQQRREARELDELATQRYARSMSMEDAA